MDRNRTVAGLDVHKDSIYLCIMGHDEAIIFEKTYGVLTPDLRQMCHDMIERGVTEAAMESTQACRGKQQSYICIHRIKAMDWLVMFVC